MPRVPRPNSSEALGSSASNRVRRLPPPPSRSFYPAPPPPRPAPPPPSSPWLSAPRAPGLSGGLPGRGGAAQRSGDGGAGRGRRTTSQPSTSSKPRASGPRGTREEGSPPPARPERSLLFPARSLHAGTVTAAGGEDRRVVGPAARRRIEAAACHAVHGAAAAG